jgi:hypothetical protein
MAAKHKHRKQTAHKIMMANSFDDEWGNEFPIAGPVIDRRLHKSFKVPKLNKREQYRW